MRRSKTLPAFLAIATVACSAASNGSAGSTANTTQDQQPATAKAAAVLASEERVYRGACDGSAAVMLNDRVFASVYDEDNVIRLFPITGGQQSAQLDSVGTHLGIGDDESDLEGAARIGDRIYWIGSMGENDDGEAKPERRRFFATDISGPDRLALAGSQPEAQSERLFRAILAAPALQDFNLPAAAQEATKTAAGLNIEGLAATRSGGLIIGFRGPLSPLDPPGDRRAIVVTLTNPGEVIAGRPPQFENGGTVRLGDRGIRSIEYVPTTGDYLILAGPVDAAPNFALFRWSGNLAEDPVQLQVNLEELNPESLALLPDGRLLVLSDDGEVRVGERKCKHRDTPPEQRSFRGRIVPLP